MISKVLIKFKLYLITSVLEKWEKANNRSIVDTLRPGKLEEDLKLEQLRLPRFWASQQEVKTKLKEAQENNELKIFRIMADREVQRSYSCNMYLNWGLNRELVKKILRNMSGNRILQYTFGNLVGATRFKAIEKGELRHTRCPKCRQAVDSWKHCVECYTIGTEKAENEYNHIKKTPFIKEQIQPFMKKVKFILEVVFAKSVMTRK